MSLVLTREALSNQIADDLATRNTNAGLIEGAVDGAVVRIDTAESDIATLESDLGLVEIDVATLNGDDSTEGSVAKTVKDAIAPVSTSLDAVKVKTTENDLAIADIRRDQTLANQSEAKISVSDYGIVALPKNATGNLKMKREGLTARNLVVNGDFSDGTTGWNKLTHVSLSATNRVLRATLISTGRILFGQLDILQAEPSTSNVFIQVRIRGSKSSTVKIQLSQKGIGEEVTVGQSVGVTTEWQVFNVILTGDTGTGDVYNHLTFDGTEFTTIGDWIEIDGNYGVMAINLTKTFGAGNEPTEAQCKNIFPTYFADTKSVPMTGRYRGTDLDGVTTHDLYLTAPEGRSVPSAKDSVEVVDGRLVHVKRVSDDYTLVDSDVDSLFTLTYVDGVRIGTGHLSNISTWIDFSVQGKLRIPNYIEATSSSLDNVASIGKYYLSADMILRVIIPKGTSLTDAKTFLTVTTPMVIAYQLATPITTPIDSDGAIPAGASVFWEPAIPDVGIYTDKFEILDTTHPIASIDKLYKVDFSTGVQTQLTDAVLAGDGLSFTSASLTSGDLVNVIYFYSVANPEGLTTATYLNSNVVVADSANGKYYKYKPVITNGAIASWTLTEVV